MPRVSASCVVSIDLDRNAGIGEAHGDAAAHRAGADDGGAGDRAHRRVIRHVGDLRDLPLGEKGMDRALALR